MKYLVAEENLALVRAIGTPRTVLDVGCGIGLNGAVAKRAGARVTGIETDERAAAAARERLDEVLAVDITDDAAVRAALGLPAAGRRFDLILFADVLEHVADPIAVLRRLLGYLAEDGHVVVSLPNVAAWTVRLGLLAGRFDYRPSGILDDSHLRFFTRDSARRLLEEAGLEVLRIGQNPMIVRAAKDLVVSAYGLREAAGSPETFSPTALADSLPYKLYRGVVRPAEDALAERAPGLLAFQNVLVCRKPPAPRKLSLTVGMLTMDEEESIAKMIGEIREVAPDARIVCVDSSKDRTPEIAKSLGARVFRQIPARGHGPAMERLMKTAAQTSDLLIYLDCDFTYPTKMIPVVRALVEQEGHDVVNCARTRTKPEAMPLPNFLANRAFAALAHVMHGIPTCDVHSGMRAYRTSVIRAFDFDGEGDALPIDTLLFPAKCGYRVVEIPIDYNERVGTSKLRKLAGHGLDVRPPRARAARRRPRRRAVRGALIGRADLRASRRAECGKAVAEGARSSACSRRLTMRLSKLFALVVSGFGAIVLMGVAGCDGSSDGSGGSGGSGGGNGGSGGGTTTGGAACDPACDANKGIASQCVAIVDNKDAAKYGLRMSQLTLEKPAALANPLIAGIIDDGVTMNLEDCFLTGDGTFSWLLEFDSATGKLKTGGAEPAKDPTAGYCFVNTTLGGQTVAPLVVDAAPDATGKFSVTVGGDVVVPIFLTDVTDFILLPLREAKIIDAVLTSDQNCIGKFNADKLDAVDVCEPAGDVTRFENGATLDGYITLEDADAVKIAALSNKSLCTLLTGEASADDDSVCPRDGAGKITSKGDWCSTTNAAADAACADAYKLGAKFAATAVKINGDCP